MWQDELKVVGLVLVEGDIKARQGGSVWQDELKVVGLVLVEGDIKARQGVFVVRCGVNLAVYKRKVEIVI